MSRLALFSSAKLTKSFSGSAYASGPTATPTVIGTGSSPSWSAATRNASYWPFALAGVENVQNLWSFVRVVTTAPFAGAPFWYVIRPFSR